MNLNPIELDRHITGNYGEDSIPAKQELIEHLLNRRLISEADASRLAKSPYGEVEDEYDRLYATDVISSYIEGGNAAHDFDEPPSPDDDRHAETDSKADPDPELNPDILERLPDMPDYEEDDPEYIYHPNEY